MGVGWFRVGVGTSVLDYENENFLRLKIGNKTPQPSYRDWAWKKLVLGPIYSFFDPGNPFLTSELTSDPVILLKIVHRAPECQKSGNSSFWAQDC